VGGTGAGVGVMLLFGMVSMVAGGVPVVSESPVVVRFGIAKTAMSASTTTAAATQPIVRF